jgi:hypothetical protein
MEMADAGVGGARRVGLSVCNTRVCPALDAAPAGRVSSLAPAHAPAHPFDLLMQPLADAAATAAAAGAAAAAAAPAAGAEAGGAAAAAVAAPPPPAPTPAATLVTALRDPLAPVGVEAFMHAAVVVLLLNRPAGGVVTALPPY